MAKFLKLGADPESERWVLADDADVAQVQKEIEEAMAGGRTARVKVVLGSGHVAELIVNGRSLEAAMAWEIAPKDPTFSIID
jgi:hypothetical protein